jgi:hypothetical protein
MGVRWISAITLALALASAWASEPKVAVFDFEIMDTSLEGAANGLRTFAPELGAKYSVTGWIQKVSNLLLSLNVIIRDAETGKTLWARSVDMRGNTDESWSRALDYLVRNYLLAPGQGAFL